MCLTVPVQYVLLCRWLANLCLIRSSSTEYTRPISYSSRPTTPPEHGCTVPVNLGTKCGPNQAIYRQKKKKNMVGNVDIDQMTSFGVTVLGNR
jgi:hypothetical protein